MRAIFVNPAGQLDNIGDSVLRRAYLDALRDKGVLHVLAGQDDEYNSGLGLQPADVVYRSSLQWLAHAVWHALRRRLTFAINAGEFVGHRVDKRRSTWQLFVALIARLSGGQVLLSGVSIRPGTEGADTHLRRLARLSSLVSWRDAATQQEFQLGDVQPDWALHLGSQDFTGDRPMLAIALRGDRPAPSDGWVLAVRELVTTHRLRPCVVVQVRRDGDAALELAARLQAEVLDWPVGVDHAGQEAAVRAFFRTCRFVVSDRIHALIIGATEGALPVGVKTSDPAKLTRTFERIAPIGLVDAQMAANDEVDWQSMFDKGRAVLDNLPRARRELDERRRLLAEV
jgi:polysaccharide pyruvyl transferase WcaK-like protein